MKTKKELSDYIKYNKDFLIYLIIYLITVALYKFFTKAPFSPVHDIILPFDSKIPFIPEFIFPYNLYAPFTTGIGIYLFLTNVDSCKKFYLSLIISRWIAYFVFVVYSVDISAVQPIITDTDFASTVVKLTYASDTTFNSFPSLHTTTSTIIIITAFTMNIKTINKIWIIAFSLLVISTTVLVKQHAFVDVPAGIVCGILGIILGRVCYSKIRKKQIS